MTLHAPILGAITVALSMATAGSATIELLARFRPGGIRRETRMAVHVWWPVIAGGALVVLGSPWVALVVFALVSAQLLREFLTITAPNERGMRWAALLVVPIHYAIVSTGSVAWLFGGILAWALLVLPIVRMFAAGPDGFMRGVTRTQWALLTTVLGASHLAWIRFTDFGAVPPAYVLSFVLLSTFASDACQWVWGKSLGRTPLVPKLSPKKTWEGLIGGTLTVAALMAIGGPALFDVSPLAAAALAGMLVPIGLMGDLVIAAIKRDAGVKDSGRVLPGQGGLLDRFDALLFTAPVAAHLCAWWLG